MNYDVIVIGAGHAGCEAAWAAARLKKRVLIATMNLDSIAHLACNPSIGGTAKGHLVCEIDALGGLMGIIADKTAIQIRMLNVAKGAAVFSLRAQTDKIKYHSEMKSTLENIENITIKQGEVKQILHKKNQVAGIKFTTGEIAHAKSIIVATGVYLQSKILIGNHTTNCGPAGFARSNYLTKSLLSLGLKVRRFKTGTPPRVNSRTIDFAQTEEQPGDEGIQTFSFLTKNPIKNVVKCHLTYTNPQTHEIIRKNIDKSAMYSGKIRGVGARYCPSIEDKIMRFPERERHQVFLEPESLCTRETYLQGLSTSLPHDVQRQFVQSIAGLARAEIMRDAYAIEYDCIDSLQLTSTLEYSACKGLFFAGQINGTSGYEEAAAQGIVAGINAARHADGNDAPFILSRTQSYIGVLIDDLVTVGTDEPYRMFTSRAEHRLNLRQDNADLRLTPIGRQIGLVDDTRWRLFNQKLKLINKARAGITAGIPKRILEIVAIEQKYAGYLKREEAKIAEAKRCESTLLPRPFDYSQIISLRKESQIKLNQVQPENIAQAGRISGVTPADINVLIIFLKKYRKHSAW